MNLSQTVFTKQCIALILLIMMSSSAFVQFNSFSDIQAHLTEEAIDLPDEKMSDDSVNGLSYFILPQANKAGIFINKTQLPPTLRNSGKIVQIHFEIHVPPPELA
jgi:hypothetical protein